MSVTTLIDGDGFSWDIEDGAGAGQSQITNGSGNVFAAGGRLAINYTGIPGGSETYVEGTASTELSGRQVVISQTIGTIAVTRRIYVPAEATDDGWARFFESFTNNGASAVTLTVRLRSQLTDDSDHDFDTVETSDGDSSFETSDRWIESEDTDGGGGNNDLLHLFRNSTGLVPTSVSDGSGGDDSDINIVFSITLQPGETKSLLHFIMQQANHGGIESQLNDDLEALTGGVLSGLSVAQLATIVNFGGAGFFDGTPPAAPTIDLETASDSGSSNSDNITNDQTPTLSGTAEANSTVRIYNNATLLDTVIASAGGAWTWTPGSNLAEGNYAFRATATDAANNTSGFSSTINATIDITPPAQPTINLVDGSDSGSSNSDDITNDTTPTLNGNAETGSTVRIFDGATQIGSVVASGGTWSFTVPGGSALSDGIHNLKVHATDVAGNQSADSTVLPVTIDTVAPAAPTGLDLDSGSDSGSSDTDNITNDTTPQINGNAVANSIVAIYVNGSFNGTTTSDGSGNWSYTPSSSIGTGSRSITARARDVAGNESGDSAALNITIDTTAPTKPTIDLNASSDTGSFDDDEVTKDDTPTFSGGNAGANNTVNVYRDGILVGTTTSNGSGNWSLTLTDQPDGTYDYTAQAVDTAGNLSVLSNALEVTIDTDAPDAPSIDLNAGSDSGWSDTDNLTNDSTPLIGGTSEANALITLYDGGIAIDSEFANGSGNWSENDIPSRSDGVHNFTATATDLAGNESLPSSNLAVTVDTDDPQDPTIDLVAASDTGVSDTDNITSDNTPTLVGTAEPFSKVEISVFIFIIFPIEVAEVYADEFGNWTWTPAAPVDDGTYRVAARSQDAAGNWSGWSDDLWGTIDTDAPNPPTIGLDTASDSAGTSTSDDITNDNTPTLSGNAPANHIVRIYDGGIEIGSTTSNGSGNWSFTVPGGSPLSDGVHNLTAKTEDTAGNLSTASTNLAVTIDTVAPNPPTIDLAASSDTGASDSDNVTADNTPLITGTAEPGSKVRVYDDGNLVATVTATPGGTWSTTLPALANGLNNLTATAEDVAGNVSDPSATLGVTVDTDAPVIGEGQTEGSVREAGNFDDGSVDPGVPVDTGQLNAEDATDITWTGPDGLGSFSIDEDGLWTYTLDNGMPLDALDEGDVVIETYTATVTDGGGLESTVDVTITITGTNDAPVANTAEGQKSGSVTEAGHLDNGTVVPGTPTANGQMASTDVDEEATATWSVNSPTGTYGSLAINAAGAWTYTLDNSAGSAADMLGEGESDVDTFTVTVTDDKGAIDTEVVTITVNGTNDRPSAVNDALTGPGGNLTNEDTVATIALATLLANDSDVDGDTFSITSVSATSVQGATVTLGASISYNPTVALNWLAAGQVQADSFTYTITDSKNAINTATAAFTVVGVNDPIVIVTEDLNGGVTELVVPVGNLTDSGVITFSDVDLADVHLVSLVGTYTGPGSPLGSLSAVKNSDTTGTGTGGQLTWTYTVPAAAVEYLNAGETKTETFEISINDQNGSIVTKTITVVITGTNDAPVILPGSDTSGALFDWGFDAANVFRTSVTETGQMFSSDSDATATRIWSIVGVSDSPLGELLIDAFQGKWFYNLDEPAASYLAFGESTTEYFTVRVTDDNGAFDEEQVAITIIGSNEKPTTGSTTLAVTEALNNSPDENVIVHARNGTITFADLDITNTHTVSLVDGTWLGTLELSPLNQLTKSIDWSYSIPDSLLESLGEGEILNQEYHFTITDNHGGSVTHVVTIELTGTNDPAEMSLGNIVLLQGLAPVTGGGSLTIADIDNPEQFVVQTNTAGTNGSFSIDANGNWSFTAADAFLDLDPGELLTDVFTAFAVDGTSTTVTVTIIGNDELGTPQPDFFETDEATPIGPGLNLFDDNGFGPDIDTDSNIEIIAVNGVATNVGQQITLPSGALLTVNADGTFSYDPNDAFNSLATSGLFQFDFDEFDYTLNDNSSASVLIQINGLSSPEDLIVSPGAAATEFYFGTPDPDSIMLQMGGYAGVFALASNDGIYFGNALGNLMIVNGGDGTDTAAIQGSYPNLILNDMTGIEVLLAVSGHDPQFGDTGNNDYFYFIKTRDLNVDAGNELVVMATGLGANEPLNFDGSEETDGAYRVFAGRGVDNLTGGNGNDGFFFGADGNLTGADRVNGGQGADSIALRGNYVGATAVVFQDASFTNIDVIALLSGHTNEFGGFIVPGGFDYDLTLADGNVAAGQNLDVVGSTLWADESMRIDGSAETNGTLRMFAGAGDDTLLGGAGNDLHYGALGADTMNGNGGNDTYAYRDVAESTASATDTVTFGAGDKFDLGQIDANSGTPANDAFSFIGNAAFSGVAGQLRAFQQGAQWIVQGDVNGDGVADLVIAVDTAGPLVATDFVL